MTAGTNSCGRSRTAGKKRERGSDDPHEKDMSQDARVNDEKEEEQQLLDVESEMDDDEASRRQQEQDVRRNRANERL